MGCPRRFCRCTLALGPSCRLSSAPASAVLFCAVQMPCVEHLGCCSAIFNCGSHGLVWLRKLFARAVAATVPAPAVAAIALQLALRYHQRWPPFHDWPHVLGCLTASAAGHHHYHHHHHHHQQQQQQQQQSPCARVCVCVCLIRSIRSNRCNSEELQSENSPVKWPSIS